ncbi:hypothetical protein Avbf_05244 [Armadillidium vulgare]|nr:hypothetical protein Avbf_05244 [Armadillidium vulgare]
MHSLEKELLLVAVMKLPATALVIGAANIGLAILASNSKGLIDILIKIAGTYSGPIVGVFLIGFFLPKCNIKGVWTGFMLSYVMVIMDNNW